MFSRPIRPFPLGLAVLLAVAASLSPAADSRYNYAGPPARSPKPLQVLLVTGCDYPGHQWPLTTPVLAQGLRSDPRADVRVVEDAHFLDSAALSRYHVVVLHYMNWKEPGPGEAARRNLTEFVKNGGGLVLVHFACGAWLEWPGFVTLAGRVWDPKLPGHDPRGPFTVTVVRPDHPIMRGLSSFTTDDELYTCLSGTPPIEVLAQATSKVDRKAHPMAFVHQVGQGRVFHSPLGHDVKAFNAATLELFRRSTAWAAGLPPTPP
jgi:type 1 glutamine amidotransferase